MGVSICYIFGLFEVPRSCSPNLTFAHCDSECDPEHEHTGLHCDVERHDPCMSHCVFLKMDATFHSDTGSDPEPEQEMPWNVGRIPIAFTSAPPKAKTGTSITHAFEANPASTQAQFQLDFSIEMTQYDGVRSAWSRREHKTSITLKDFAEGFWKPSGSHAEAKVARGFALSAGKFHAPLALCPRIRGRSRKKV